MTQFVFIFATHWPMKRFVLWMSCGLLLFLSCEDNNHFIEFTYPDGKYKALILSYDDGTIEDIELARLFDAHHLVGTFNLNSGYLGTTRGWPQNNGDTIYQKYVPKDSLLTIYKNHEIAAHGVFHKNFVDIAEEELLAEIINDRKNLKALTNREVISLAYPFGNTNKAVSKFVAKLGIVNGRTVADTHDFDLPENYMIWHPTCHDSKALTYLDTYLNLDEKELSIFYVWGHSWEFGDNERWNNMIDFCNRIGKASDIWSVGHGELTRYLKAIKRIKIDADRITNPSDNMDVWLKRSTGIISLKAGETIEL